MPSAPAKPRRPRRRRPAPDADPLQRLLVKCDGQGQPVCDDCGRPIFWVIDASGHLRRLVFPARGVDSADRPPAGLPAPMKIKPGPGQRRPPKTPAGTWEDDDDLLAEVSAIVGKDRRDRKANGSAIVKELRSMAARWLGRPLTPKQHDRLQALTLGQEKICRALGRDAASRTHPVKASAIARELLAWRHKLTDPVVRRMQSRKPVAHDFAALVLKYESEQPLLDADGKPVRDEDGRPILARLPLCDEEDRPILWVPDEQGQPSRPYVADEPLPRRPVKIVRPRVKMIFR